jgi:hypothetical protein
MSISTHADLKSAIALWLNRSDLTAYIPDFIRLGETRIFYGSDIPFPSQPLRIPAMQARETGTITAGAIAFPTRFLEPIRIAASSGGSDLSLGYVSPDRYSEQANGSGVPTVYTYLNNEIQTAGTGAASYILDYYQAFAGLAADADTNWLLTNAPGVYLYASLLESAPFLGDSPLLGRWHSMFKAAIGAVNRSTKYQAAGSLATRVVL